ncbi:MAG: hypothetical protein DRP52_06885 [Planctomycetota bacterium]|nr:MAG: hypothetical protein DRP52_06885 [Planctomycetota bacterium]
MAPAESVHSERGQSLPRTRFAARTKARRRKPTDITPAFFAHAIGLICAAPLLFILMESNAKTRNFLHF